MKNTVYTIGLFIVLILLIAVWLLLPTPKHDIYLPTVSARELVEPAQQQHTLYLPAVQRPQYQGVTPRTEMIYDCQCGAVTASLLPDGKVLLAIQDHSRAGRMIVGVDDGVTFRELESFAKIPMDIGSGNEEFHFPGLKQGVGSALYNWGSIVMYAPNRTVPDGKYQLWRHVQPYQ
jgi:hypothetical protein